MIYKRTHAQWEQTWNLLTRRKATRRLNFKFIKKILIKYSELRRAITVCLIQMRTEKITLIEYLHVINRVDINRCSCQLKLQTIRHVLLKCFNWKNLRTEIWDVISRNQNLAEVLKNSSQVKIVSYFMLRTSFIKQFRMTKVRNDDFN